MTTSLAIPPFNAETLSGLLVELFVNHPEARDWKAVYADVLVDKFPMLDRQDLIRRFMLTARAHHQFQDITLMGVRNSRWAPWYAEHMVSRWEEHTIIQYPIVSFNLSGADPNHHSIIAGVRAALIAGRVLDGDVERFTREAEEVVEQTQTRVTEQTSQYLLDLVRRWVRVS
jgi:hypothetical protein